MSRSKSPLLFLDLSYHHRDDLVAGHCYRIHVCDVEISGVVCRSCWRFCDSYVLRVSTLIYSAEFLRSVILINKLVKRWRLDLAWLDLGSTAIIPSSHTFGNTNIRHYRRGRKGIHKGASYSRCTPWKCSDLRYSLDWLSLFDVLFSSKTKYKAHCFYHISDQHAQKSSSLRVQHADEWTRCQKLLRADIRRSGSPCSSDSKQGGTTSSSY